MVPLAAIDQPHRVLRVRQFRPLQGDVPGAYRIGYYHRVGYLRPLAGRTYVLAVIIDALAPVLNGQRSQIQALKVAAHSSTASWVAGLFQLIPELRVLTILGCTACISSTCASPVS